MQKEVKLKFMQGFTIFEDLAEQTLYNIIYEKSVNKKFKPKQLVMKIHPRSPFSPEGRPLYDSEYGSHMKNEVNQSMQAMGANLTPS